MEYRVKYHRTSSTMSLVWTEAEKTSHSKINKLYKRLCRIGTEHDANKLVPDVKSQFVKRSPQYISALQSLQNQRKAPEFEGSFLFGILYPFFKNYNSIKFSIQFISIVPFYDGHCLNCLIWICLGFLGIFIGTQLCCFFLICNMQSVM